MPSSGRGGQERRRPELGWGGEDRPRDCRRGARRGLEAKDAGCKFHPKLGDPGQEMGLPHPNSFPGTKRRRSGGVSENGVRAGCRGDPFSAPPFSPHSGPTKCRPNPVPRLGREKRQSQRKASQPSRNPH